MLAAIDLGIGLALGVRVRVRVRWLEPRVMDVTVGLTLPPMPNAIPSP